ELRATDHRGPQPPHHPREHVRARATRKDGTDVGNEDREGQRERDGGEQLPHQAVSASRRNASSSRSAFAPAARTSPGTNRWSSITRRARAGYTTCSRFRSTPRSAATAKRSADAG